MFPSYITPTTDGTLAIFGVGVGAGSAVVTTRDKYTYSGDVVSSATAATIASQLGSAVSNGVAGVNM